MGWLAGPASEEVRDAVDLHAGLGGDTSIVFRLMPGVIYVFAVAFGIAFGGDYMIIPLMAADLFGLKVMGRVMGIILTADGLPRPWRRCWSATFTI